MSYRGVIVRATGPVLDSDTEQPLEGNPVVDVMIGLGTDGDPITDTQSLMAATYQLDSMGHAEGRPPAVPMYEADDAQGMLYVWLCPACGQPLPEGARCNSGVHQGPDTIGTEGTERDTRPFAVRSIDLDLHGYRMFAQDKVLSDLVAHENSPCRFDHHGYCQEHGWLTEGECAIARGRRLLSLDKTSEIGGDGSEAQRSMLGQRNLLQSTKPSDWHFEHMPDLGQRWTHAVTELEISLDENNVAWRDKPEVEYQPLTPDPRLVNFQSGVNVVGQQDMTDQTLRHHAAAQAAHRLRES